MERTLTTLPPHFDGTPIGFQVLAGNRKCFIPLADYPAFHQATVTPIAKRSSTRT